MSDKVVVLIRNTGGKGGGHGGAWKVAFADFMTSMMAFFLVMWLLSALSSKQKAEISQYFKTHQFTIFPSGKPAIPEAKIKKDDGGNVLVQTTQQTMDANSLKALMTLMIESKFPSMKDNLVIHIKDDVVRLEIADSLKNPLFDPGSAELKPELKRLVQETTQLLKFFDNKLSIEGHTDSTISASPDRDNWSLSLQRTVNTQKEFISNGIYSNRFIYLVGFADNKPLKVKDKEKIISPDKNRRVTILIFCSEQLKAIEKFLLPEMK